MQLNKLFATLTKQENSAFTQIEQIPQRYNEAKFCQDKAAVLILFIEYPDKSPSILFTKRTMTVKTHKGQVCFPGGHYEPQDKSLIDTGLRECQEEIGINSSLISVIGTLPLRQTRFNQGVLPIIGTALGELKLTSQPSEVATIFEVPLAHTLNKENYYTKPIKHNGKTVQIHFIDYHEHVIWGFTAEILWSLQRYL